MNFTHCLRMVISQRNRDNTGHTGDTMTMKRLLGATLVAALLTGCITSHWGGGLTANLYSWDDRLTPLTSRTTFVDTFLCVRGDLSLLLSSLTQEYLVLKELLLLKEEEEDVQERQCRRLH